MDKLHHTETCHLKFQEFNFSLLASQLTHAEGQVLYSKVSKNCIEVPQKHGSILLSPGSGPTSALSSYWWIQKCIPNSWYSWGEEGGFWVHKIFEHLQEPEETPVAPASIFPVSRVKLGFLSIHF